MALIGVGLAAIDGRLPALVRSQTQRAQGNREQKEGREIRPLRRLQ